MIDYKEVKFGFIDDIIKKDLEISNVNKIKTRFPPEPNGCLHIGHAKAIVVNFGIAKKYNGSCNLRFDNTNPLKEDAKYIESIIEDIKWLGFETENNIYYTTDYFGKIYKFALGLVEEGEAYVCQLSPEEIREYRGTLTAPGKNSPYRDRPLEENIRLFKEMKDGKHPEGSMVLRLKINMASPNLNLRDPIIYRIIKTDHHTGEVWNIYPMYDFAHPIEDAIEGISHSLCSLEFEDHRSLYEYILGKLKCENPPKQREFARLNINYTVISKRRLLALVEEGIVEGWDDPRMPTIAGLRRRGYTNDSIIKFVLDAGISKSNSIIDISQLEAYIREELNYKAKRVMGIIDPLKVIVTNFPKGEVEWLDIEINPEQKEIGTRRIPFARELYIEKDDFLIEAQNGYRRLYPGNEVRFKGAFYLTCENYETDDSGEIKEVYCTYDKDTKGGWSKDGRKVQGTIHWLAKDYALKAEYRLFDKLFNVPNPEAGEFRDNINRNSLKVKNGFVESYIKDCSKYESFQFLRKGYFILDKYCKEDNLIFNRIVSLKDSFNKRGR